ncbi:MAG: molecular chaperone DnaJ, partial [Bacteroidota bacterium]
MGFGKWLGGGIGWAVGGPIGGLFGFALGAMFDNTVNIVPVKGNGRPDPGTSYRHQTTPDDFLKALLVLSATVMKADGRVMKSELDYVRHYL